MADHVVVDLPREACTVHPILLAFLSNHRDSPPTTTPPLPRFRLNADGTDSCSSELSSAKEVQVQCPCVCPDFDAEGDVMVVEGSSGVGLGLCKEAQADFVALFILLVMAMRRPKAYLGGLIRPASVTSSDGSLVNNDEFSGSASLPTSSSILLSKVSKDALDLLDVPYLMRKFNFEGAKDAKKGSPDPACVARFLASFRLMDVVKTFQFVGIKRNNDNYVNKSLVQWSLGLRPFVLLFYVPTPMEVLRMQSVGERVVTMFVTAEALSKKHSAKLYYMDGAMDHEKDPLEFTIHDMKHMENFTDPAIFAEQVGFFRCMLHLGSPLYRERVAGVMAKKGEQFRILTGSFVKLNSTGTFADDSSKHLQPDCYPEDLSQPIVSPLTPDLENDRLVAPAVSTLTCDIESLLQEISSPAFEIGLCPARNWALARWSTEAGSSRPKHVFTDASCFGLDATLWHELEYVISDMNCFSTHLLQYLLAKMMLAVERRYPMPLVSDSLFTINSESKSTSTSTELMSSSNSSKVSVQCKRREMVTLYWILVLRGFGMIPESKPSNNKAVGVELEDGGGGIDGCDERIDRLRKLRCAAFSACLNMLSTSYRERGPMTAQEGQDIRDYFGLIVGWGKG